MFGPKKQVLAALFPRMGQPHKPAEIVGEPANLAQLAAAPARDAETPATHTRPANDTDDEATTLSATVTSLDMTRLRRMADIGLPRRPGARDVSGAGRL